MCYSQSVWQDYRRYMREFGVKLSIREYFDFFVRRSQGEKLLVPKGLEDAFLVSQDPGLEEIQALIAEHRAGEGSRLEQELFAQRTRLVEAERKLQTKVTKAASESKRIAGAKVERAMAKLADMRRVEPKERDFRFFPGWYSLVMVVEEGKPVVHPMRYHCRPTGKPARFDLEYPGTYNAFGTLLTLRMRFSP